jgi:hypothetical protein
MNFINAVVHISIVLRTYSGTEGTGLHAVEVCLQIVLGTIDRSAGAAAVDVWTVSQSAVGMLQVSCQCYYVSVIYGVCTRCL